MLLVPTYVASSKIHGIGLFAAADIPKDTVIWEYRDFLDRTLRLDHILAQDKVTQQLLAIYCYEDLLPQPNPAHYIWCGDDARFVNHSDTPTMLDTDHACYAPADIPKGTELTSDYADFGATVEPIDWQAEAKRYSHLLLEWGGQLRPHLNGHARNGAAWATG